MGTFGIPAPITIAVIGAVGALAGSVVTVASATRRSRQERRLEGLAALGEAAIALQAATTALDAAPFDRDAAMARTLCRGTFELRIALVAEPAVRVSATGWLRAVESHVRGDGDLPVCAIDAAWRELMEAIGAAARSRS